MPALDRSVVPAPYYDLLTQDKGAELVSAITPEKINISFGLNGWNVVTPLGCAIYGEHIDCVKKLLETPGINLEKGSEKTTALSLALMHYLATPTPSFKAIILLLLKKKPSLVAASVTTNLNALPISDPIRQLIEALKSFDAAAKENRVEIAKKMSNLYVVLGDIEHAQYRLSPSDPILHLIQEKKYLEAISIFQKATDNVQNVSKEAIMNLLIPGNIHVGTVEEKEKISKAALDALAHLNPDFSEIRTKMINYDYQSTSIEHQDGTVFRKGLHSLYTKEKGDMDESKAIGYFRSVKNPLLIVSSKLYAYIALSFFYTAQRNNPLKNEILTDLIQKHPEIIKSIPDLSFHQAFVLAKRLEKSILNSETLDEKMSFYLLWLNVLKRTGTKSDLRRATELLEYFKGLKQLPEAYDLLGTLHYQAIKASDKEQSSEELETAQHFFQQSHDAGNKESTFMLANLIFQKKEYYKAIELYISSLEYYGSMQNTYRIKEIITKLEDIKKSIYLTSTQHQTLTTLSTTFPRYDEICQAIAQEKMKSDTIQSQLDTLKKLSTLTELHSMDQAQLESLIDSEYSSIKEAADSLKTYFVLKQVKDTEKNSLLASDRVTQDENKKTFQTGRIYDAAHDNYLPAVAQLMEKYVNRYAIFKGSIRRKIYLCTKVLLLCTDADMAKQRFPGLTDENLQHYITFATNYLHRKSEANSQYPAFTKWCLDLVAEQKSQHAFTLNPDVLLTQKAIQGGFLDDIEHAVHSVLSSSSSSYGLQRTVFDMLSANKISPVQTIHTVETLPMDPADIIKTAQLKSIIESISIDTFIAPVVRPNAYPSLSASAIAAPQYVSASAIPADSIEPSAPEIELDDTYLAKQDFVDMVREQAPVTFQQVEKKSAEQSNPFMDLDSFLASDPELAWTPPIVPVPSTVPDTATSSCSSTAEILPTLMEINHGLTLAPCDFGLDVVVNKSTVRHNNDAILREAMSAPMQAVKTSVKVGVDVNLDDFLSALDAMPVATASSVGIFKKPVAVSAPKAKAEMTKAPVILQ